MKKEKITLFLPNGIGDLLMSLPLIRRLISSDSYLLAVVVSNSVQESILNSAIDSELIIFKRGSTFFSHFCLLINLFLFRANICFAPLCSNKFLSKLFFFLTLTNTILPKNNNVKFWPFLYENCIRLNTSNVHQVNYYIKFLKPFIIDLNNDTVSFSELTFQSFLATGNFSNRPLIAFGISCGFRERHKIPSPEIFARIANEISIINDIDVLVFGSSQDLNLIETFSQLLSKKINVFKLINSPIDSVITTLSSCTLGITGTTGQGHMMAAANLPVIVLSGVTNELESGPYTQIIGVVKHNLPCSPCYSENFLFGCNKVKCMEEIDVNLAAFYASDFIKNFFKDNRSK